MLRNVLSACHRNNIGTSKAFNSMKQQLGGLANVGCVKRDLQNFHRDLKALIKNSDAHRDENKKSLFLLCIRNG